MRRLTDKTGKSYINNTTDVFVRMSDGISHYSLNTFTAAGDGNYYAKHARLDMINGQYDENTYIDIAYLGLTDELSDLDELAQNAADVTLVDATGASSSLDFQQNDRFERNLQKINILKGC